MELSKDEMSVCADLKNLPHLSKMWDDMVRSGMGEEAGGRRAYKMLATALWWHRYELIGALDRKSRLRLVHSR